MGKDKPEEGTNKAEPLKHRIGNYVFVGGRLVSFLEEGKKIENAIAEQDVMSSIKAGNVWQAVLGDKTVTLKVNKIGDNPEYLCTTDSVESLDKLIPRVITKEVEPKGTHPDGTEKPAVNNFEQNKQIINA